MKPPAFQFYADDFLGGTQLLTNEEAGIYIRALCHQWNSGGLSDLQLERLGLGLGFSGFPQIKAKFDLDPADGLWKNQRLEAERVKQSEYREKQSNNGKKGGRPKGLGYFGLSQTEPKKSSPSPSPSPSPDLSPSEKDNAASPLPDCKEEKTRKAKPKTEPPEIPQSLRGSAEFLSAWGVWLDYLRQRGKTATAYTQKLQLSDLEAMGPTRAIAAINNSIGGGWQKPYEPKNGFNNRPNVPRPEPKGAF